MSSGNAGMLPILTRPHQARDNGRMWQGVDMAMVRARLAEELERPGQTARGLSLRAGLGPDAIRDIMRGKSKTIELSTLTALSTVVGFNASDFVTAPAQPITPKSPADLKLDIYNWPKDIPVSGTALGASLQFQSDGRLEMVEQTEISHSDPIDFVRRPPALINSKATYALYVVGSSMEPRYQQSELIYVDPRRPPAIGDHVVVQLRDGSGHDGEEQVVSALVKKLVRRSSTDLELEQYNPPMTFTVPLSQVKQVHRVVPWGELFSV